MTELELRQMFKNLSDCYADTGRFENDGSYTEGEVIQAMTEDRFIEVLKEAKLLPIPYVSGSLPSVDEAGVMAIKISEMVEPPLTEQEQSFFIAGFCECVKWLGSNDR